MLIGNSPISAGPIGDITFPVENTITADGGVVVSGEEVSGSVFFETADGGSLGGGESDTNCEYTLTSTIGCLCGGSADISLTLDLTFDGGVICNGGNLISHSVVPFGVALAGGTITLNVDYRPTMSGSALVGGTASFDDTFQETGIGGALAGGTTIFALTYVPDIAGGSVVGGDPRVSLVPNIVVEGGVLIGGNVFTTIKQHVSGGVLAGGNASFFEDYEINGGTKGGGNAIVSVIITRTTSGGVKAGGIAAVNSNETKVIDPFGVLIGGYGPPGYSYVGGDRDDTTSYTNSITMGGMAAYSSFVENAVFNGHGGFVIGGTSPFLIVVFDFFPEADTSVPIRVSGNSDFDLIYFDQSCEINKCRVADKIAGDVRVHCLEAIEVEAFDLARRTLAGKRGNSSALLPAIINCRQKIFQNKLQLLSEIEKRKILKERSNIF